MCPGKNYRQNSLMQDGKILIKFFLKSNFSEIFFFNKHFFIDIFLRNYFFWEIFFFSTRFLFFYVFFFENLVLQLFFCKCFSQKNLELKKKLFEIKFRRKNSRIFFLHFFNKNLLFC